jgi:hypothetical protein
MNQQTWNLAELLSINALRQQASRKKPDAWLVTDSIQPTVIVIIISKT